MADSRSSLVAALELSESEVEEARNARDYDGGSPLESVLPLEIAGIPAETIAQAISQDAHDLVVKCEVTSREVYERRYQMPIWPGLSSGITIGIGFDVGQHNSKDFELAWKPVLDAGQYQRLAETVGVTGEGARGLVADLADIKIGWDTALKVYHSFTVPKFGRITANAFPHSLALHPSSFGSLFSLVYNRGAAMNGERRVHMRNIRGHMHANRAERVPDEIRAMKALWSKQFSGLHKRREAEAALFEQGILLRQKDQLARMAAASAAAAQTAAAVVTGATPDQGAPSPPAAPALTASSSDPILNGQVLETRQRAAVTQAVELEAMRTSDGDGANREVDFSVEAPTRVGPELESTREWASVSWAEDDANSPEYAHILEADRALSGCRFELTGRDLELIIKANSYQPLRASSKIVFSLRGAQLDADATKPADRLAQIDRPALRLIEGRPNHKEFRCTVGVYDLTTGTVSGFIASTVPNPEAVLHGKRNGGNESNMLPSGCYMYVVGNHKKVPGCLREGENFTVLRNSNNLTFDVKDRWSKGFPADNIHPAARCGYGSAPFSSYGCMVIKGTYSGSHNGEWGKFRDALGLDDADDGDQYSVVVTTGLEAAVAYDLRIKGQDGDPLAVRDRLGRLRHGSQGDYVVKLQQELNKLDPSVKLPTDGKFGPDLKVALASMQAKKQGKADAVYAPAIDAVLGIQVMTSPPPPSPTSIAVAALEAVRKISGRPHLERVGAVGQGDLEALYHELGRRARMAERDPAMMQRDHLPPLEGWSDELVALGRRMFMRIERSANRLLCGDSDKDQVDRAMLWDRIDGAIQSARQAREQEKADEAQATHEPIAGRSAIKDRALAIVSATPGELAGQATSQLAGGLVSSLGIASPIAGIVAHIIVQQALVPALDGLAGYAGDGHRRFCRYWSDDLDKREQALSGAKPQA